MSAFFVFSKSFRRAVAGGGGLPLPPICPPPSLPPVRWGGGSGERVSAPLITRNCPGPPLPWGGLSGSSEEQLLVARSLSHPEVLAGVVEGDDVNKHTPAGTSSQPLALLGPWRLLVARPGDARMLMCRSELSWWGNAPQRSLRHMLENSGPCAFRALLAV